MRFALVEEGWNVYRDPQTGLNHLPGANPGTPYTLCGVDAGLMTLRYHDPTWAGVWCTACFRSVLDNSDGAQAVAPKEEGDGGASGREGEAA